MKRIAIIVAALLATATANAEIYQWKDKNGKTIISDKPPTENVVEQRVSSDGAAAGGASAPKTAADRDMEFRKRQKESQEKAEKTQKEQAAAAEKEENCANARRYLATLESGERVALRDEKGERYFLDDAQRAQEISKANRAVQASCAK